MRRLAVVDTAPAALREQVPRLSDTVWNKENAAKWNDFLCVAHTRFVATPECFYSMLWVLCAALDGVCNQPLTVKRVFSKASPLACTGSTW